MKTLTLKIEREIEEVAKEFGFTTREEFISQAVRKKILELKKMKFFALSEKTRKGILKKGIKPEKILKQFKS